SSVEKNMGLSYDNQTVNDKIKNELKTTQELEMFWLSPIEMQNVSVEIYELLVKTMPSKKDFFEENFEQLMFDLDSLYANIEGISSSSINNMIVSDNLELNIYKIHYIENIYLDPNDIEHTNRIEQYITVNDSLRISTSDPNAKNYFDLLEVQSVEDYNNGLRYNEIMYKNFQTIDKVLK
ncbi:MAG: hypothetical protein ACK5NF_00240, partial [Bacilli bacterium]